MLKYYQILFSNYNNSTPCASLREADRHDVQSLDQYHDCLNTCDTDVDQSSHNYHFIPRN